MLVGVEMDNRIRFCDRGLQRCPAANCMNVAWKLGAAAVCCPISVSKVFAQPSFRAYPFTLGVASGEPLPNSMVLSRL